MLFPFLNFSILIKIEGNNINESNINPIDRKIIKRNLATKKNSDTTIKKDPKK